MSETTNKEMKQVSHTETKAVRLLRPITECVNVDTHLSDALRHMAEYRYWSGTTLGNYVNDVTKFEEFLMSYGVDPSLQNGEHVHFVDKWIKDQKEAGVAYKTICRRIASLSSMYTFYSRDGVAIVRANPFRAAKVPGSHVGSHSPAMDIDDLKDVYVAIQELKEEGIDIEVPIKLLMFTGLRNHSFSLLKVKDINWDAEVLIYNSGIDNNKHKFQVFPLPKKLLACLKEFIQNNDLQLEDPLCYGLKGMPLSNKQLNRITDTL